jgi:hypothetical protein
VLCPFFVTTGITRSERNRPAGLPAGKPTRSQLIGQAMSDKAVGSGKVTAAMVAQYVFDALARAALLHLQPPAARWPRCRCAAWKSRAVQVRNPTDP